MKTKSSARNFARSITVTAVVFLLAACGGNPVPVPAPPSGNNYGYGQGMGNCGSVSGAAPVQTTGQTGYYADLLSPNPVSSGDFVMTLFYQKVPVAGSQVENVVGAGAVKIPALTGYLQNSIVPVCVTSNNNSPGLLNVASGGVRIKMTGPLPVLPQGTIPGGMIPTGWGYQTNQSMGSVEIRIGYSCDAWIVPQGRVIGCIDVISYGYPGGSQSYRAQ